MNHVVREDLYRALNELLEKQFEEFKWRLKCIDYDGKPHIPTASLENANRENIVDLMIHFYGEDARKVCIQVLQKSNINDVAKKLEETLQKVADVDAHQLPDSSDYRSHVKKKFQRMEDPNSIPGEYVPLNQRYSKLIILDYHRSEEEREDEIMATGRKHAEIISKRAKSSTSMETLFNLDKHGLAPQVVVLQGAAGIGKTTMAKKIMFDWASQQLYQDKFNHIFYIYCREMNLRADSEKSSIAEIVSKQCPNTHAVENVNRNLVKNVEKLLFIIDGFDELRYSFDQSQDYFCTDPWKKEPVRILLSSLFQKKLLPKSYLIITTRPTALEKLHRCLEHPRYFEILGFSPKEREEYFYNFFENKDQAAQAFRLVKQNDTLFTMCVIPLVSWIVCTVMKQEIGRDKKFQKTPYTLTAIYMLYLSSLLKFHQKKSKQDVQTNVKGLCSLAAEGIWKREILFMEEEVKKHSLDQEDSLPLFLNQNIFQRDIDCIQTYSFIHLSFQEFFAALFYVLEEGEEQRSENLNRNLQTLLERHTSSRLDFAVGFRFLFGFLNEGKRMTKLKKEFGWKISPKNKEFLLDWMKNNIKKGSIASHFQKEMFTYLYETQDDNFVKNALYDITEIHYRCNSGIELIILAYCVQHCQNLEDISVHGELFSPENEEWNLDERCMEDLFKALIELRNLRSLGFIEWSFTESSSRHLAEVLRKNQRLSNLELTLRNTGDRAVEFLFMGLQQPDCKVERLRVRGWFFTDSSSRHLAEVFRKNQSLRELELSLQNRGKRAVELLCEGLQHPACKIERLRFIEWSFTESSSRHLAEVLRKNQRLSNLELTLWDTGDRAVELLCRRLQQPDCKVERLRARGWFFTESSSRHLAEVFRKNQRLSNLDLTFKHTSDRAVELLCEGLQHPDCKVETLRLDTGFLTASRSWHLAEVLRRNQRLRELFLSFENKDVRAVKLLCEGLKHPECKVEKLWLHLWFLTKSCSTHLAEVLRKSQRLRELFLSFEDTENSAVKLLCEGLKHPECKVKKLQLNGKDITQNGEWNDEVMVCGNDLGRQEEELQPRQ
ncbi:NACHT, LRR and PYD domains-containing protein 12-like isoform X2 [Candoia aspera]|uniref:NACHT, LRR and PYD domains-containing protein 12-like isoform X2 n=1 Tax=Candoia aspera TaxID=51853 RepID=UPI002FD86CB8